RRTALHIAVLKGHNDIVKHLLSSSASPNCFDDRGFTPLMYAVTHGKADMVDSLLNHGASPDIYGPKWREMAVNTIVALLAEHSNLAATDKWGLTAMNYAVYNQYSSIQMELLEKGAILDAKQHDG
ncbi:ankyrin, partial [Massarina eburnea CBS 473.64]